MTIIEKIKQSVEGATGMPFLYHASGELNELIARCKELPVAYSFLLDSGTIDDVNGRYHERVTLAVMFCDKTEFDFNALENEEVIDRMKVKAYKWIQSLRMSNALRVVSVNNTQRLYDNTTDVLTGFAVNITLEDIAGVGECELPDVVFEIKENGKYPVVGVDKVRVNVVPKLEELEITENGEYLPPIDIAGFSKVVANVLPKNTDLVATENDKEYLPADYGVDAFGKVKTELRNLVKVASFKVTNNCINEEGRWEGESLIDTSTMSSFGSLFKNCTKLLSVDTNIIVATNNITSLDSCFFNTGIKEIDLSNWDVSNVTSLALFINSSYELTYCDVSTWDTRKVNTIGRPFYSTKIETIDFSSWELPNANVMTGASGLFFGMTKLTNFIGGRTIEDVLTNNLTALKDIKVSIDSINSLVDRASLRALINGLADLTGQITQTLTLGAILIAKLTEEDIAIATSKNWTIV